MKTFSKRTGQCPVPTNGNVGAAICRVKNLFDFSRRGAQKLEIDNFPYYPPGSPSLDSSSQRGALGESILVHKNRE